jgi:hypothetical protein
MEFHGFSVVKTKKTEVTRPYTTCELQTVFILTVFSPVARLLVDRSPWRLYIYPNKKNFFPWQDSGFSGIDVIDSRKPIPRWL